MTKDEKRHLDRVSRLGCIVCRNLGFDVEGQEVALHHPRAGMGTSQRSSHYDVLPICPPHHQTGGYGIAYHAGPKIWQEKYGTETELLEQVKQLLEEEDARQRR
jgi:hypothetical protein